MTIDLLRLILSVYFGIGCGVLAIVFASLYVAGRIITKPEDRTPLGTRAGRFFLAFAGVCASIAALFVARWADLNKDEGAAVVVLPILLAGGIALTCSIVFGVQVFPLIVDKIRKGEL